ncbi:hypothetical protein [Aeromonas diversa]|uniref:hypothetical protein n=1 Tax=Aeromonas diversa TaxID=502790 RepID=UPI0003A13466|nr:hypothetical protein [Aeromonas diversa]
MLMHTQAVTGLPPNHPWAMSDKELIRQLQALSANLPPHMAALIFEAAQRITDYSEES